VYAANTMKGTLCQTLVVCCSVHQCVAVYMVKYCSVLQYVAVCVAVLGERPSVFAADTMNCNLYQALQCVAVCCSVLLQTP